MGALPRMTAVRCGMSTEAAASICTNRPGTPIQPHGTLRMCGLVRKSGIGWRWYRAIQRTAGIAMTVRTVILGYESLIVARSVLLPEHTGTEADAQ